MFPTERIYCTDPKKISQLNDILISVRAPVGDVNLSDKSYCIGRGLAAIRTGVEIDSKYLFYYFLKNKQQIADMGTGSTFKAIGKSVLADLKIPLPPLPIQKKIVQVLDKARQLIDLREKQMLYLDELVQSFFYDMFGDPVTNPKGWDYDSLSNYGSFKNGLNFAKGESGNKIRYLGVGDFKSHSKITDINSLTHVYLNETPSEGYFLTNGDIVFVRSNGNRELVGRCLAIYPDMEKVTFSGFCIRFRINNNEIDPIYLVHLFRIKSFKKTMLQNGRGANIQNINQKLLSGLEIPMPPQKLQNEFANKVQKIEAQKVLMQESLEEMKNNYNSLMQRAFKGKLF